MFGKITYGEVVEAIGMSNGLITGVARRLGISVYYVRQIFAKYKTLGRDFDEYREIVKDELETALLTKARLGDTTSLIFALKCIAKDRGYVEFGLPQQKKSGVKIKIVPAKEKPAKVVKMVPKKVGNG